LLFYTASRIHSHNFHNLYQLVLLLQAILLQKVIDDHLANLKEKIDKGYVYKRRKKATTKHNDDSYTKSRPIS